VRVSSNATDEKILADWALYKETGDREARERLILAYAQLVKYVASRVGAGLPQSVDNGDLVSYGTFGLIDAIEKFDPGRGYKFETYAITRIKGAILDELRSIDWIPRSIRSKQRSIETASRKFETKHHRSPTEAELAVELELSSQQLRDVRRQVGNVHLTAFEEVIPGDEQLTVAETITDSETSIDDDLSLAHDLMEMRQALAQVAAQMSERDQMVLILYYQEGLTLAEIGHVLGVTESRICQIHTKAVMSLRENLVSSDLEPA
jgi:RNA polymerase sigma factor FliA